MVARHAPGSKVSLTVLHDKHEKKVDVTLDKLADEKAERDEESSSGGGPATPKSGELGIGLGDAPGGGALVQRVSPNGPAREQLEPGDVIVEVNRKPVRSAAEAATVVRAAPSSQPLLLTVKREGHTRFVGIERK
jgi:serine protease Do